jgi:heme/copper-type cytochrome/quinol oxidase subunit 2
MQRPSSRIIAIAIAAAIVAVGALLVYTYAQQSGGGPIGGDGNIVQFTIYESDKGSMEGMNGSALHFAETWPVITVQKGDTVIIHLISENASEPHGFTIDHYFFPGVALWPGGRYTVKFVASQAGDFVITCLIFCAIHPLMDHGEFIVEA